MPRSKKLCDSPRPLRLCVSFHFLSAFIWVHLWLKTVSSPAYVSQSASSSRQCFGLRWQSAAATPLLRARGASNTSPSRPDERSGSTRVSRVIFGVPPKMGRGLAAPSLSNFPGHRLVKTATSVEVGLCTAFAFSAPLALKIFPKNLHLMPTVGIRIQKNLWFNRAREICNNLKTEPKRNETT